MSTERRYIASIILPLRDNDGKYALAAHKYLEQTLAATFGGYTTCATNGAWLDEKTGKLYTENGKMYSVAMTRETSNKLLLSDIAIEAGTLAKQLAVAVTFADGEFVVIDLEK